MRYMQTDLPKRGHRGDVNTIRLTIDGQDVTAPEGATILEVAEGLDIRIPTLCYLKGYEATTSCMICVVHDLHSDRLIPACSMPVSEGMRIETGDSQVRQARKDTLDMLLSEHVGDCEAPCQRACPAHMNIPLMVRLIHSQRLEEAIATVKRDIALPATLGRICPAPCEAGCNRKPHDGAVSVCLLKRFAADADLEKETPYTPELPQASGKRVAVVGGGPTGLSAAYYLIQRGHAVSMYDTHPQPGGMLRYGVPDEELPRSVLDAEIAQILQLGVDFHPETTLGRNLAFETLRNEHDAVVLALGRVDPKILGIPGLDMARRGIAVQRGTYETSLPGVFAGGNAVSESQRAIRALAHGKEIACSVDQFLNGLPVVGEAERFVSRMGRLIQIEHPERLQETAVLERVLPAGGRESGFDIAESAGESTRCLHCDCRKLDTCKLRLYAEEYQADQTRFKMGTRQTRQDVLQHGPVIYEPGKCIKCGLCVQIAREAGEGLGLSFVGRGFNVRVEVPFNESLENGLKRAAQACIEACPTAALAWGD